MTEADASLASGVNGVDLGDDDFARTILPPIGSRGSRRLEFNQNPQEVDKFSRAMDKVMADRVMQPEDLCEENAASHIIARRETEMASKHGISRVGKGVVEKFNAARHNTAIMSAMGHPGLEKLMAKEEQAKRKRKARLKELSVQRSMNGRQGRTAHDSPSQGEHPPSAAPAPPAAAGGGLVEHSSTELPNVYVALGQATPGSNRVSMFAPSLSPRQQQSAPQHQQQSPRQLQPPTTIIQQQLQQLQLKKLRSMSSGPPGRGGGRGALSLSAPGTLRPAGYSGGGEAEQSVFRGTGTGSGSGSGRRGHQTASRWRRRAVAAQVRSASGSGEPQIRAGSRVGRVLAEFGGHTDWCSVTVLRHSMATILQANIRGWLVRRKWQANPQALVEATKASLEAESKEKARRAALKAELERRAMTRRQKEKAANVLQMLFPQKSMVGAAVAAVHGHAGRVGGSGESMSGLNPAARAKWNRLNKNMDLAKELEEGGDAMADVLDESDSDMSDLGVEEMALIKMRARTPPWQKVEQSQWEGQWAKLNQRARRGNLDVVWDLSDTAARVQTVQQRRAERGLLLASATSDTKPYDPATQPLPASVVSNLLVHRYIEKYSRLGLMDHLPLRSAAEAALEQQQQQQLLLQEQLQQQQAAQQHLQALQALHQQS